MICQNDKFNPSSCNIEIYTSTFITLSITQNSCLGTFVFFSLQTKHGEISREFTKKLLQKHKPLNNLLNESL